MPQGPSRTPQTSPAQLQSALGFVPQPQATAIAGGGVSVDTSGQVSLDPILNRSVLGNISGDTAVPVPIDYFAVTFGVGAPAAPGLIEGDIYYDTTIPAYVGYVWHLGAWNQF